MIHHVFANRSNAGDWLSARGIQSLLAPWPVVEHWCDAPFVSETLATLARATERDFIIIGGGGLFMDYFVPFWEGFLSITERVPFVIWGVGYCDMKRERTIPPPKLIEEIVSRARLCVVRDDLTHRHLARCQLPPPVPCPAMVAVPTAAAVPEPRLLHVDHFDNVGKVIHEFMVKTGEMFAEKTGRSYRQTNNLLPGGHFKALGRIVELYTSADLVLTSRLHGCIMALATGRRVLAVSADHKVESFMAAAGLSEWVMDLDSSGSLMERLHRLPEQKPPCSFVERARAQNRSVAARVRELITAHPSGGTQQ